MTFLVKKPGRKSNAEKAAMAAAENTQELAKIEPNGVVTDMEPASKASVTLSVDPNGEDLGDVSNQASETSVIASGGPVDPDAEIQAVLKHKATFTIDLENLPPTPGIEKAVASLAAEIDREVVASVNAQLADLLSNPELGKAIQDEIDSEIVAAIIAQAHINSMVQDIDTSFEYELEAGFKPMLNPTMVRDEYIGHIPCPRAVFDLVKVAGWQTKIDESPAHVKSGLKSVLYWKRKNGTAKVRCHSSSKFGDVV